MKPSPQQVAIFEDAATGEGHTVVQAMAGCLAGETLISLNRAGAGRRYALRDVVARFNGASAGGKVWAPTIPTFVRAPFSDGLVHLAKVVRATFSGVKPTWAVRLKSGVVVRATADHLFMTPQGWVAAGNLSKGMAVLVEAEGLGSGRGHAKKRNYVSRLVPHHPHAVNNGNGQLKVPTHRLQIEAQMNGLDLETYVWRLQTSSSGLQFLSLSLHVHHKDGNPQNNGLANLEVMTQAEHNRLHGFGTHLTTRLVEATVLRVDARREEETFDLSVPGPDAFLANGMAVHNSGKTTTLLGALGRLPPKHRKDALMVAFNKSIADELKARVPGGVAVSTLHSYGLRQIKNAMGYGINVDPQKTRTIIRRFAPGWDSDRVGQAAKLLGLAKGSLISSRGGLDNLLDAHGIDLAPELPNGRLATIEESTAQRQKDLDTLEKILAACREDQGSVDFDDMIWFPNIFKMPCEKYAYLGIDEIQDLNVAQVKMSLRAIAQGGRALGAGDPNQAIYQFRGAHSGAVKYIVDQLQAKRLGLTVTYRCARKIVERAKVYLPEPDPEIGVFTAREDAPDGEVVEDVNPAQVVKSARPGDFVLCRANAPLIGMAFALLRAGKPAAIAGKDIGGRLRALVLRSKAPTVEALLLRTRAWRDKEIERLKKLDRPIDIVTDTEACVRALAQGCASIGEMVAKVDRLFRDEGKDETPNRITLSTVHKAKGLEADRVWILWDSFHPRGGEAERNLAYCACTRAKNELYFVREPQEREE